jgi:hypothetical protein
MVNAMDAVNAVLAAKWPGEPPAGRFVYVDLLPKDFKRPSFFIEQVAATPVPETRTTVEWTVYLTIHCFVETNNYNQQSQLDLLALQKEVLDLFGGVAIPAGDRFIKVDASSGGSNPGVAYVDLTIVYSDDRPGTAVDYEKMQHVQIDYRGNA